MTQRKKVVFLSGTRADFGKIKPLISKVQSSDLIEYQIFATGMHLLERYGYTLREIEKSGFDRIYPFINQDSSVNTQMDLVLANTIQGFGLFVREYRPDLLIVHGDRCEALAGAIVGALNNILVAHVEGGEVSGTVDELIRHAVTKLAHAHFVSNGEAKSRLIQMGEDSSSIFEIGSPNIDLMLSEDLPSLTEVKRKYEIDFHEYGIFVYHPVTTELYLLRQKIHAVCDALEQSGLNYVILYPNNDMGANIILEELQRFEGKQQYRIIPSMRFEYYLTLLKYARVLVGNSSSGIHEAPVYGVPTINVGSRQRNRFQYKSISNVNENDTEILLALQELPKRFPPTTHFGIGDSANRFLAVLHSSEFWQISCQKQFVDLQQNLLPLTGNLT